MLPVPPMSASPFTHRIRSRLAVLALGAAVFVVSACSSERPTEPEALAPGTFSLRVSGIASRSVAGHARYSTDLANSGIGTAFTMRDGLTTGTTRHALYLYRWSTEPLRPGTYDIVPNDEDAAPDDFVGGIGLDTGDSGRARACVALEGTLHVTATGDGRIAGSVRFSGACVSFSGLEPMPVVIQGRFEAEREPLDLTP